MYKFTLGQHVMETIEYNGHETFPQRLKRLRKKSGFTQDKLATLLGITQPSVNKYEAGTKKTLPKQAEKLAEILGVTPEYLLYGRKPTNKELVTALSKKLDASICLSTEISPADLTKNKKSGSEVTIYKTGQDSLYKGNIFTFVLHTRIFAPKYLVGDIITFNEDIKPSIGMDVLYVEDGDALIGTYRPTKDKYIVNPLNDLTDEAISPKIIGAIIQTIRPAEV